MDLTTLLLLGGAAYFLFSRKSTSETLNQIQSRLQQVQEQAQKAQDDITATNKAIQEENYIREQEEIVRKEEADVAAKCYPVGFYGVIGNYYTSDKLVSYQWYLKFENTSNTSITVNLESLSVTILNSKQIRDNTSFIRKQITVQPKSSSGWVLVTKKENAESYGYSTFGKDIQQEHPDHRYDWWYKAEATIKYSLSNPYVNNGLPLDVPAVVLSGGVYGVRVYEDLNISKFAPKLAPWADYHIDVMNWYDNEYDYWAQQLGYKDYDELAASGDLGARKKLFRTVALRNAEVAQPVLESGIATNRFWMGE